MNENHYDKIMVLRAEHPNFTFWTKKLKGLSFPLNNYCDVLGIFIFYFAKMAPRLGFPEYANTAFHEKHEAWIAD